MPDKSLKSLQDRVIDHITDQLPVDRALVVPEALLIKDLGAESLDIIEIVMLLEEEFGIDVPDKDVETLTTVGKTIVYVEQRVAAKKSRKKR